MKHFGEIYLWFGIKLPYFQILIKTNNFSNITLHNLTFIFNAQHRVLLLESTAV